MRKRLLVFVVAAILSSVSAQAAIEAVTSDGRRVLLKDDHTWEYVDESGDVTDRHVLLTVVSKSDFYGGCKFGLQLTNNAGFAVRQLVPQFTAFTRGSIRYDTKFVAFASILPTRKQYRELKFDGVKCSEIDSLKVHGADRCSMGELNKFAAASGECLDHIRIADSDIIRIYK